ncbi:hypothetical protein [Gemmatimonas sp.]|uniref:hypothetical protein n=1 Tax=Gemmatimonas sp. TaxID=1962908 RepID=UPI003566E923
MSAAGGPEIRVTDDAIEEADLQWIGSELTIGFGRPATTQSHWAVDLAGGGERQLTSDSIRIGNFRPSPVNDEAAYVVERGGGVSELRVLARKTGESRTVVGSVPRSVVRPFG